MSKESNSVELAAKVIEALGGPSQAAETLETTRQVVHSWTVRGLPVLWEKYLRCSRPELF